jgi:uncharacterized membrane protein/subtilisin family serine protease
MVALALLLAAPAQAVLPASDAATGGTIIAPSSAPVMLYLKAGTFDPVTDPAPGPAALHAPSTPPLYVVQFDGPIQKAWRDAIAGLGATTLEYLPDFAYFARVPDSAVSDVRAMPHVRYVGPAHPAYRLHPQLWSEASGGPARELSIGTWDSAGAAALASRLEGRGASVLSAGAARVVARAPVRVAVALLGDASAGVSWVEPWWAPQPLNDNDARTAKARQQVDGAYDPSGAALWSYDDAAGRFEGYPGRNVTIAVADTGLDDSHPAFAGRIVHYFDYDGDGYNDEDGHGTHTSGTALGDGSWRAGDPGVQGKYAGVAPQAGLVVEEIFTSVGVSTAQLGRDASNEGATVSSNSWIAGYWGDYNGLCQEYDAQTRDANNVRPGDQPIFYSFGAGNDGYSGANTIAPPSLAKNVLSVGSVGDDRWGASSTQISGFSSRGPTNDGRIKPDVLMPGDIVESTRSMDPGANAGWTRPLDGGDSYVFGSGTSMATPGAAGAAAVVRNYLKDVHGEDPSPSMVKALLINGAIPLAGYTYPGFDQGWGRVDLDRSLREGASYHIYRFDQQVLLDTSPGSDEATYWFMVYKDQPLKVTLTWTDVAGAVSSTKNLVSDLDLELWDGEGFRYSGNDFLSGQSRINSSGNPDRTNNVEGFLLDVPREGLWYIKVRAYDTPQGAQDFSLVVSGDVRKGHIDLAPETLVASPPIAEEYSQVHLTATVANLGNRDAAGVGWRLEHVDPDLRTETLLEGSLGDMTAGAERTLELNVTGVRGYHVFRLRLDPDRLIVESNETNNALEVQVFFRGYDVTLSAERTSLHANPATLATAPMVVRNRGNVPDTLDILLGEPPPGWRVDVTATRVPLDPDGAQEVALEVVVPPNATAGEVATFLINATSEGNSSKSKEVRIQVQVNQVYGLEVSAISPRQEMRPGQQAELDLLVRNTGNGRDTLIVAPGDPGAGWSVHVENMTLAMDLRSDVHVTVLLTAPDPAVAGRSTVFPVNVSSSYPGLVSQASFSAVVVQIWRSQVDVVGLVAEGRPKDRVVIPLRIANDGNGPVEYDGDINFPSAAWVGGLDIEHLGVPAYGSARANLTFTVPADAINRSYDFTMVVISSGGEGFYTNFTFTVKQFHGITARVVEAPPAVTQGMPTRLRLRMDNYGNGVERLDLTVAGSPAGWTWTFSDEHPSVEPFSTGYVSVDVVTTKATSGARYESRIVLKYGDTPRQEASVKVTLEVLTRADLQVLPADLNLSAMAVKVGTMVRIVATVTNIGQTEARDFEVQLLVDGAPVGQQLFVSSIAPGEAEELTFVWTANRSGVHELGVRVDPDSSVDEVDSGNNVATTYVEVKLPEVKGWPTTTMVVGMLIIAALVAAAVMVPRLRREPL